ncbi:MAG: cadherin-like domain-containing protein [Chloroflexi bacterium]|nr:cadherin-like domain-containing protein [Chloroflexota bacterium]
MRAVSSRVSVIPWQHARWCLAAIVIAASLGALALVPLPAAAQTVNEPPVAEDDAYSVDAGTTTELDVLANDSDPDGDTLTITSVTGPTNGATVLAGGVLSYTPNGGFTGDDSFTYTVSDGNDHSDTATVTVTVSEPPIGAVPQAEDDAVTIDQDTSTVIDVLANDTDADADALTVTSVTTPTNGTATITGAGTTVTYAPNAGYTGADTFDYTVDDGNGNEATATVSITVQADVTPADPVAADDSATTPMGAAITIDVLANDTPSDGANALTVASATMPANGTVVVNADDTITYTPDAGFSGADSFDYTVSEDGAGTATATVTVTVQSSPGNGNGDGCTDGEWVAIGLHGLGFCMATPNVDWTGDGQQIFPDGLFPAGIFPHGLFPDGVFGDGDEQSQDLENALAAIGSPASPTMPEIGSLAEEIMDEVHASMGW